MMLACTDNDLWIGGIFGVLFFLWIMSWGRR